MVENFHRGCALRPLSNRGLQGAFMKREELSSRMEERDGIARVKDLREVLDRLRSVAMERMIGFVAGDRIVLHHRDRSARNAQSTLCRRRVRPRHRGAFLRSRLG